MKLSFEEVVVLTTIANRHLTVAGAAFFAIDLGKSPKFDASVARSTLQLLEMQHLVRIVNNFVEITKQGQDALHECRPQLQAIFASVTRNTEFR